MKLYLFAAFALAACSATSMDLAMSSWNGYPVQSAIEQWGEPDAEAIVNGKRQLHWTREYLTVGTYDGGSQHRFYCTRTLIVAGGKIVATKFQGNDCSYGDRYIKK